MGMIRGVGFDLDGTLFDHKASAQVGVDDFFVSLGLTPSQESRAAWFAAEEEQFELWRASRISFQEQRRQRLRSVLPQIGLSPPDSLAELDRLFERYLHMYRAAWRSFPDSKDLLQELRKSGYQLGVLTNGALEQQTDKLRTLELEGLFDAICISESAGIQKPDPRAFENLAEKLQVTPQECLFIGDHPVHDLAGAHSAGMQAILVDRYRTHTQGIAAVIRSALNTSSRGSLP